MMIDGWQARAMSGLFGEHPAWLAAAERLSSGLCVNCGNPVVNPRHWRGTEPVHVECLSKLRVDTDRNEV